MLYRAHNKLTTQQKRSVDCSTTDATPISARMLYRSRKATNSSRMHCTLLPYIRASGCNSYTYIQDQTLHQQGCRICKSTGASRGFLSSLAANTLVASEDTVWVVLPLRAHQLCIVGAPEPVLPLLVCVIALVVIAASAGQQRVQ